MKKVQQFYYDGNFHRGIQFKVTFCAHSKKEAAKILNISSYVMSNYVSVVPPNDKICIDNIGKKYTTFDSGELWSAYPDLIRKLMSYEDMIKLIDDHRKKYKTSHDFWEANYIKSK